MLRRLITNDNPSLRRLVCIQVESSLAVYMEQAFASSVCSEVSSNDIPQFKCRRCREGQANAMATRSGSSGGDSDNDNDDDGDYDVDVDVDNDQNRRSTMRSGHSGERYAYALVAFGPGFLKRSARRLRQCRRWLARFRRVRRLSAEERLGDERPTVSQAPVVDSGSYRGRSDREDLPRGRDAMFDGERSRSRAQWVTKTRRMGCLVAISFRPYCDLCTWLLVYRSRVQILFGCFWNAELV